MNGLQRLLRPLSFVVFHLLLTHYCRGQSQVIGPSQPVVAIVGHDIILPCHVEPEQDVVAMTLEWTRSDLSPEFIHVRRSGTNLVHAKHPSYEERTSLSIEEMKRGNVSLKLTKVKFTDAGKYKCYIPKLNAGTLVELVVASDVVSAPVISLSGIDKDSGGVVLQCDSTGWSPEPEVFWLDGEGNLLSAGPPETVRGPDDLYTVSSRVTVEKRHSNSFTCRVTQKKTNQTRDTQIQVPEDFFNIESSSSSSSVGFAVGLAVCILIILILLFIVWRQRSKIMGGRKDVADMGERKSSKSDKNKDQSVELMPLGTNDPSKFKVPLVTKQRLKEEKQGREEAENNVKVLEEQLWVKTSELDEKLQEEKKRTEKEKKELVTKNTEWEKKFMEEWKRREEAQTEVSSLQIEVDRLREEKERRDGEREKLQQELKARTREVNNLTADVEKLKEENKDLQKELENKNKEWEKKFKEEKKGKEDTDTKAWSLQIQLEKQLKAEKERSEKAERELKDQRTINEEWEKNFLEQTAGRYKALTGVWSLQSQVQKIRDEKKRRDEEQKKLQQELEEVERKWKQTDGERNRELKMKDDEISQLQKELERKFMEERKGRDRAETEVRSLKIQFEKQLYVERKGREEAEDKMKKLKEVLQT